MFSLTGSREIDMLNGPLWDKILQYAVPLAVTGIMQQMFNAADIAVVGRFTGTQGAAAMAAVGASGPIIGLILNSFIGISLGTNVIIANSVGRNDSRTLRRTVHTSIIFSIICGLILTIIGEFFAVQIMSSQNVPSEVLPMAVVYFRIFALGIPGILLYNFESAIFRGIGDTETPLRALMISGVLNVILNLIFVLGMNMTVEGVAIATVISSAVSSLMLLHSMLKGKSSVSLHRREMKIDSAVLKRILHIGVPAGLQSAVFSFANIIIQSAINSLGTIVMAASAAAFNIEIFAYNVLNSFGQACTTFVGQNSGAGNMQRCRKVMGLCLGEGIAATAVFAGLIMYFSSGLLSLFNPDPEVIRLGQIRLAILFASYIFSISYEVMSGYLRGFGISVLPAVLTMVSICSVRIFWIYVIFPQHRTFQSIMMAYPFSLGAAALLILAALLCERPAGKRSKTEELQEQPAAA